MTVPNETDTATRKAAVYRLYAADGALLYIGSAYDPETRYKAHTQTAWWPLVTSRTEEWFDNRSLAYAAETDAIWIEQPRHNEVGTIGYQRTGTVSNPLRQRASYLAWTGLRDACAAPDAADVYKKVLAQPDAIDGAYLQRAERAAAELTEDIQGLAWNHRRRTLEMGRKLLAQRLRNEGANDIDVATVMAATEVRVRRLPYLLDDERHGSRRAADGTVTYVAYAERGWRRTYWSVEVPSLACGSPLVNRREDVEGATRLAISRWTRTPYESVGVRVRFAE